MKLKKLAQVMLISCGVLALGACSTTGHNSGDTAMVSDEAAANGAQASGVGQGQNFGDNGSVSGSRQMASKRTYYFDFDKSDIRTEDKPAIMANADYLVAHPNVRIIMEGHTDPRGSREYNVALGERRANAVFDMLKSRGVNPDQVRVVSYGAERLAVPGNSEQNYQLDRRAIIVLTQK